MVQGVIWSFVGRFCSWNGKCGICCWQSL